MKLIDPNKIQTVGGIVINKECPLTVEKQLVDDLLKYCSVDISEKYISIEYLHKSLVDALYERKISSEIMQIFHEILGGWKNENNSINGFD